MLEPVQIRLPGFSALYRYTKFGMASPSAKEYDFVSEYKDNGFTSKIREFLTAPVVFDHLGRHHLPNF